MELYAVLDALTHIAPCKGGRWPSFWALLHGEAQGWKRIIARNKQMATVRVPLRECEYILVSLFNCLLLLKRTKQTHMLGHFNHVGGTQTSRVLCKMGCGNLKLSFIEDWAV